MNIFFLELTNHRYITPTVPLYELLQRYDNHLIKTALSYLNHIAPSGVNNPINTDPLFATVEFRSLKAKLACHPARCLLPVEIIKRCSLATGPASVELLPYLLPY